MADRHDKIVSAFRARLQNRNYRPLKNPFVDYRPDISVAKGKDVIIAEVEIEQTIHSDHTLEQLLKMHKYVRRNKKYRGLLIVPKAAKEQARILLDSLFDDGKIRLALI